MILCSATIIYRSSIKMNKHYNKTKYTLHVLCIYQFQMFKLITINI